MDKENRLIFKTPLQAVSEGLEGKEIKEREEKEVSPVEKELFEVSDQKTYEINKDLKTNIDELLHVALKLKYRTWYLPDIWSAVLSKAHEWKNLIPDLGKKPQENQASTVALEAGQIIFLNEEGKELLRIDVSMAFRERESIYSRYGLDKKITKSIAERRRQKEREKQDLLDHMHFIAARGLKPAEAKPKGKMPEIDPNEVRQNTRIMEDFDKREKDKESFLKGYRLAPESGYNLRVPLHESIAVFDDDDWAEKWKDVAGRTSVERLLTETVPPLITYDAFLKSKDDSLKTLSPVIRTRLTGDFEKDKKEFEKLMAGVLRAEQDKRIEWQFGKHHEGIKTVTAVLAEYEKQKAKTVNYMNPFAFHGWTIDDIRQAVQDGYNEYLDFDDLAKRLYTGENGRNFKAFREKLKELGIPEIVLKRLKGENLEEDFKKFDQLVLGLKTASEEVKEIQRYRPQVKLVLDILGDYVHFSGRLMNLMRHLEYKMPETLALEMRRKEGMDIFRLNRKATGHLSDTPDIAMTKVLLGRLFFEGVESPKRYFSLGEKFWGFLSGEDTAERVITMRDFSGKTYSVDKSWFLGFKGENEWMTQRLSSETAYKMVYEYARDPNTPETQINFKKVEEKLKKSLELGISAYRMRPDENFHKLLARNKIDRTGRFDEDLNALYKKFEQELGGFIKDLRDFKNRYTQFPEEELKDFFEEHELSDDLLDFIRLGSVIDYHAKGVEQGVEKRVLTYKVNLQKPDIEKIIKALSQTNAFSEEELQRVREGLNAGLVVSNKGGIGLGTSIPLPHGYYISAGFLVADWKNFGGVGVGIGKKIEVTEKFSVRLHGGVGVSGEGLIPAGALSLNYDFENVSVYALGIGAPIGFYAGIGIERRPEVLLRETIDRKMLEAHIEGPDGLDKYDPSARYAKVSENPNFYPEFGEVLASMDAFGFANESKSIIFEAFYEIYKEELERRASTESFPIIRGIGLGAGIATPDKLLNIVMPFKFGVANRNLVLRIADIEGIENYSQRMTKQELFEKLGEYEKAKIVEPPKTIKFTGKIIVDKNGNLSLSNAKLAPLTLDENRQFSNLIDSLEKNIDIEAGVPDENGLVEIFPHRAYGEVILAVDPDLKNEVLVVHDGNHIYLSVSKNQKVYISREDITYPFAKEGAVETTYITVRGNPYIDRRGLGSVEARSRETLFRRREMQWRIEKNPEAPVSETKQILSMSEYNILLNKPDFAKDRLKKGDQEKFDRACKSLMEAVSLTESYESQKLPEGFENALKTLTADETFMTEFRKFAVKGYDFENKKAKPEWSENLPALIEHIKGGFSAKGISNMNEMAIERALTEFVIASFIDLSKNIDAQKSYEAQLESFGRPLLKSIFEKYFARNSNLSEAQRNEKRDKAVNYIISQMKAVNLEKTRGEPLSEDSYFASLVGTKGITGIRRLYNPHKESDPHGMLLPGNALYPLNSPNETIREIARFWLDYLSHVPEEIPEDAEKIYEILRSPLALRLAPFAGAFMNAQELESLANVYKNKGNISANKSAVEKFIKMCQEVRKAELQGKTEVPIKGTDYVIVVTANVRMGVYKKCGNVSSVLKEDIYLKDKREDKFFTAVKDGVVVTSKTGFARVDFGIFLGPSVVTPLEEKPEPQGLGARIGPL